MLNLSLTLESSPFAALAIGWRCIAIKSLYTRVVLIFVGIVVVSLFLAFVVTTTLFLGNIRSLVMENLISSGKKMIQTYNATPSVELIPFMQNVADISNSIIQIYDEDGQPVLKLQQLPVIIDPADINRVLAGGIVRKGEARHPRFPIVGLPFLSGGQPYALFILPATNSLEQNIQWIIKIVLIAVLIIGSLLILFAARYIVKPLLLLTAATKQMAKGKFDIELHTKRRDELGQLTASFNEMAKELAKVDRMRQEFVTSVSHEIQSPLTSISGFTRALKEKKMSEESRLHYLTIIGDESERLSRLSQNLLRLSSLQHGQHPLQISTFPLDEQLRRIVIALEPQWSAKRLEMDVNLSEVSIMADQDQLNQVWTNLLSNSIKFSPQGGTIRMKASINGHKVIVSVTDNGPGIPVEERSDIFTPFHKVDKSRGSSTQGNGLGLAIVKQIVDIHNGEILVSGSHGQGSTFTVFLPDRYTEAKEDL